MYKRQIPPLPHRKALADKAAVLLYRLKEGTAVERAEDDSQAVGRFGGEPAALLLPVDIFK